MKTFPSRFTEVELDDLRAVLSGDKDVTVMNVQTGEFIEDEEWYNQTKKSYDDLLEEASDKGLAVRYIVRDDFRSGDTVFVRGGSVVVGTSDKVDEVVDIIKETEVSPTYHRRLGKVLGYSDDDIRFYESTHLRDGGKKMVFYDKFDASEVIVDTDEFQK